MPNSEDEKSEEIKEIRKQHWLPASYLQFFTAEQKREGYLYRVHKTGHKWVKAETQGVGNYHYRERYTHQSEGLFQVFESDYPQLLHKAIVEQTLSVKEQCKFVVGIVALHCRNPSLANHTDWDNWKVFVSISCVFLENHLGAPPYDPHDEEENRTTRLVAETIIKAHEISPLPLDEMPSIEEIMPLRACFAFY